MIPDFKTFIKESIWSDMQDRSTGKIVRKEDDVNLMSGEDFCDYLNDNYICKDGYKITYDDISKRITTSILKKFANVSFSITYSYKNNTITMNDEVESFFPELCKMVKENFKVDKEYVNINYTKFIIFPSDGSECTNRFFVDVLDFIIDNADENVLLLKKKHINESIWSDMQDRSMGDAVRKEDEFKSICEFIKDHYFVAFVHMNDIKIKDDHIYVPIYKVLGLNTFSTVTIYKDTIVFCSIEPDRYTTQVLRRFVIPIKDDINQLFDKIKDKYSPDISTFDRSDHWINFNIKPKDGKVTPKFCEDVIDFILDNIPDDNHKILKILEKK